MDTEIAKHSIEPKPKALNIPFRVSSDLSLVIVLVGVRGSGKTLLMTHYCCEALREAYAVRKFRQKYKDDKLLMYSLSKRKTNIWCNYPVKRYEKLILADKSILLQPQPLDIEDIIVWHPKFHDGIIFWDEIDQVADKQDWMSVVSKMLTAGVQVMRHRNLSLVVSIQSLSWLNTRLQWQADLIIKCKDRAFTTWGRSHHLRPGEISDLTIIDKSGIMTGYSFEENWQLYHASFYGKRYWNNYQTQHEFNVVDLKRKFKLKQQVREIDLTDGEGSPETYRELVETTIEYFKYNNPGEKVRSDVFWGKAEEIGFPEGMRPQGGRMLKQYGIGNKYRQGYNYYMFDEVK